MFRKVVIVSPALGLIPVVKAAVPVKSEPQRPSPMRPSDLPVYEAPHADYADHLTDKKKTEKSYLYTVLSEPVSVVRQNVQVVWKRTESIKNAVQDQYHEVQDRSSWIIKYLREEQNKEQRYGAVVIGGVTGFIFGLRGGIIRRLFYGTIGTGIMGSVCFPEETRLIAKDAASQTKHYVNVGYNFFYGVKPGDPQMEVKFPELSFPKDFSQFFELTSSMVSSLTKAVMPPPKTDDKPADDK